MYEPLSASVKAGLHIKVSDKAVSYQKFISTFKSKEQGVAWLAAMSKRLEKRMPDPVERNGVKRDEDMLECPIEPAKVAQELEGATMMADAPKKGPAQSWSPVN